ncbi:MAG: hypothetical protein AAB358_04170 [Patescibacteria group bacterium]
MKDALIYVSISVISTVLFYLGAAAIKAPGSDILLGIIWVFFLSLIISASIVPRLFKKEIKN